MKYFQRYLEVCLRGFLSAHHRFELVPFLEGFPVLRFVGGYSNLMIMIYYNLL